MHCIIFLSCSQKFSRFYGKIYAPSIAFSPSLKNSSMQRDFNLPTPVCIFGFVLGYFSMKATKLCIKLRITCPKSFCGWGTYVLEGRDKSPSPYAILRPSHHIHFIVLSRIHKKIWIRRCIRHDASTNNSNSTSLILHKTLQYLFENCNGNTNKQAKAGILLIQRSRRTCMCA